MYVNGLIDADAVPRVFEGKAALDLVSLDHSLEDIFDLERGAVAVLVVSHREDGAKVV